MKLERHAPSCLGQPGTTERASPADSNSQWFPNFAAATWSTNHKVSPVAALMP
jgi:hypothetical protein